MRQLVLRLSSTIGTMDVFDASDNCVTPPAKRQRRRGNSLPAPKRTHSELSESPGPADGSGYHISLSTSGSGSPVLEDAVVRTDKMPRVPRQLQQRHTITADDRSLRDVNLYECTQCCSAELIHKNVYRLMWINGENYCR